MSIPPEPLVLGTESWEFSKLLIAKLKEAIVFPVAFYMTGKSKLKQARGGGSTWWKVQYNFYSRLVPPWVGAVCVCLCERAVVGSWLRLQLSCVISGLSTPGQSWLQPSDVCANGACGRFVI